MTELAAEINKPFDIVLRSRALSGYEWRPTFNKSALRLIGKRFMPGAGNFGAAGKEVFKFQADKPGDYHIAFDLARPLEDTPVDSCRFELHVAG